MDSKRVSDRIAKVILTWVSHPYLALIFRLYIAGLFIYASMYKINYAAEFAESIAGYQIVPYPLVNLMAITLPWIELIAAILLIIGFRSRSAVVVIGSLLVVFTIAVTVNLLRDSPISCGCFHTVGDTISWRTFFRDLLWIFIAVHIFFFDKKFHLETQLFSGIQKIEP